MEEEKPKSNKWIKYAPKWLKIEKTETTEAENQNIKEADLRDWFKKEKWADVSRPKKMVNGNLVEEAIHPRVKNLFVLQ